VSLPLSQNLLLPLPWCRFFLKAVMGSTLCVFCFYFLMCVCVFTPAVLFFFLVPHLVLPLPSLLIWRLYSPAFFCVCLSGFRSLLFFLSQVVRSDVSCRCLSIYIHILYIYACLFDGLPVSLLCAPCWAFCVDSSSSFYRCLWRLLSLWYFLFSYIYYILLLRLCSPAASADDG
jgi:hypothetical protein